MTISYSLYIDSRLVNRFSKNAENAKVRMSHSTCHNRKKQEMLSCMRPTSHGALWLE